MTPLVSLCNVLCDYLQEVSGTLIGRIVAYLCIVQSDYIKKVNIKLLKL
jgi:hypothetical protein